MGYMSSPWESLRNQVCIVVSLLSLHEGDYGILFTSNDKILSQSVMSFLCAVCII